MSEGIERFFLGGIACMSAAVFTNPIDVIKVRLQLQSNIKDPNLIRYNGFFSGLKQMYLKEGISSWYKGLEASLLREGSYSTLRMGLYEPIKDILHPNITNSTPLPLHKKIVAAALSGGIGAFVANPTDLIKVRMQAVTKDGSVPYKNTFEAFKTIYNQDGIKGLYRGVGPTTQRAMLLTASQLASYDHFKQLLLNGHIPLYTFKEGLMLHFTTSVLAGLVAAITTSPLDTIKSRYMNQSFNLSTKEKGLIYKSPLHCATITIKQEGFMALYKGFFPNWIRIGPHTIITFIILENLRKLLGYKPL